MDDRPPLTFEQAARQEADALMKQDRRPPGQRSPYESIGGPRFNISLPNGRPQDAGGANTGGGGGSMAPEDITAIFTRANPLFFEVRTAEAHEPKSAAAAEERRLRPQVERFFVKTSHDVAWDDVVGNEAARAALVEAIEHPIRHADIYAFYKVKPAKGVLLYGPPGCGKTMFGKAASAVLAQRHGRGASTPSMLHINGPEILSPYVGVTEKTIQTIFAYARAFKAVHGVPLVVFIDEADSILPSRNGTGDRCATRWEESQVATFLTEMDGLEASGAFVILATNRPNAIDEAVLRDGRCDRKIKVERPDRATAETIVLNALTGVPLERSSSAAILVDKAIDAFFDPERHLARIRHDKGFDFLTLGDIVNGAMLVGLVEQAKSFAFRREIAAGGAPRGLTAPDILAAVDSVEAQNRGLNHTDAVLDFAERFDLDVRSVDPIAAPTRRAVA